MIRRKLPRTAAIVFGAALLWSTGGCARAQGSPAAGTDISAAAPRGPALWKVADTDTTIYLFGTIHALPESAPWLEGPPAAALASSDAIVTELAPGAVQDPANRQVIMAMALLPPDKNLRAMLGDAQRADYEAALAKLGLPIDAFDRFDPWFAAMTLTMLPVLKSGYKVDSGVEQVVEARAPATASRVALETVQAQMRLFDGLPAESQTAYLVTTARGIDQVVPTLDAMVEAWRTGNAERLAELMNAGLTDPVLADALLYARNRTWADWIDDRLDRPGTVFIAVGAGHLAGDKSVQDYLERRGIPAARTQ